MHRKTKKREETVLEENYTERQEKRKDTIPMKKKKEHPGSTVVYLDHVRRVSTVCYEKSNAKICKKIKNGVSARGPQ